MAQIELDISDELLQKIVNSGEDPAQFFQTRLSELSLPSFANEPLSARFNALTNQWRRKTRHLSLMSDIVLNTAYQQIIGMGLPAIPLLLRELKHQPDHWFWALRSITGENPVPAADRGRLSKMAEAWLKWGEENGYQWAQI